MDREKVIKGLETIRYNLRQMNHGLLADFCDDVLELLKEQPQIIRCKDCKHYECGYGCKLWHTLYNQNDDWFCADGERRTE